MSIAYLTTVHKCPCVCSKEVVTAQSRTYWKLVFDGETVSLDPSVGNWSFPCRSHYWVSNDRAMWAEDWSQARIDANRAHDRRAKDKYYGVGERETLAAAPQKASWWRKLLPW